MQKYKPNEININKKIYKLECVWRNNTNTNTRDINDMPYPVPVEGSEWSNRKKFIKYLEFIQNIIRNNAIYIDSSVEHQDCGLCGASSVTTMHYKYNFFIWEDGLLHYMHKHSVKPSESFIDMIYNINMKHLLKNVDLKIVGEMIEHNNTNLSAKHIKIDTNQLLILDALMNHGGYKQKYLDNNTYKYSEHSGILDISNTHVDKIIVSADISRIDLDDDEIFLPNDMSNIKNYEYIFHTHPPTPRPGGRAETGVLYEFPSFSDILHFIENFNDSKIIGSLVVTPEGLYNIHTIFQNKNKIDINQNKLFKSYARVFDDIQDKAIKKYGTDFNKKTFYTVIAQDMTYINILNTFLQHYSLIIDYYPRVQNTNNKWIIDTIYLPLYA